MSGMAIRYDEAVLDKDQNLPVLAAGELFMGGHAGSVILMASDLI